MKIYDIEPTELDEDQLTNALGRIEVLQNKLSKKKQEINRELGQGGARCNADGCNELGQESVEGAGVYCDSHVVAVRNTLSKHD